MDVAALVETLAVKKAEAKDATLINTLEVVEAKSLVERLVDT